MTTYSLKSTIHQMIDKLINMNMYSDYELIFPYQCELIKLFACEAKDKYISHEYYEEREVILFMSAYSKFVHLWEVLLESEMAKYLSDRPSIFSQKFLEKVKTYYINFYHSLINNELGMVDLGPIKTICHVGIGEMSVSSLYISRISKCRVVGLDILPKAIESTRQFLLSKAKCFEDEFELYSCDGDQFNYKTCDLVIISVSVENKVKVINRIINDKRSDKNIFPVIVRETTDICRYAYPTTSLNMEDVILSKRCKTGLITSSLYLI